MTDKRPDSASAAPGGSVRAGKPFLVFGAPQIDEAEIEEVVASMRSGWLGTGPKVAQFERDFAAYMGAEFAVAVNSCTAALHLSLIAAGIGPGDEVIVPALTFAATVNVVIHTGATPVLADVDVATMNIEPSEVRRRITSRTRALIPVHFAGRPAPMDQLLAIAAEHELVVIEDCAHAIEAIYRGRRTGSFGDFGCFSFYATKNLTTGEGGMVTASHRDRADAIRIQALHGMSRDAWARYSDRGYRHYDIVAAGFKYNMMDLQAAIGLHQLRRLEENWKRRASIWTTYIEKLIDLPILLPAPIEPDTRHAHHLFIVQVESARTSRFRDELLTRMYDHGIGVGVHYRSIPEHSYYRKRFGWKTSDYPNAELVGQRTISLPLSARLTDDDVNDVIEAMRRSLARK